jgi:broad specificity phosphatase PhoE
VTNLIWTSALLATALATAAIARYYLLRSATTIFLLRHADRAPDGELLSAAGHVRAQALARVLGEAGITAIFASNVQRTQQTAQPLAHQLGLPVQIYDPGNLPALVQQIKALPGRKQRVVVVGHNNTVPATIQLLGFSQPPAIPADQFDLLFEMIRGEGLVTQLLTLRYGA